MTIRIDTGNDTSFAIVLESVFSVDLTQYSLANLVGMVDGASFY